MRTLMSLLLGIGWGLVSASQTALADGACCLGDGSCIDANLDGCDRNSGEFLGERFMCTATTICMGACCLADKSCGTSTRDECDAVAGTFQGAGTSCNQHCAAKLSSAFTYQGQLKQAGLPLNGTADFEFSLWTSARGGDQVGELLLIRLVFVVGGLFSVPLDFGTNVFNGNAQWLEIAVRSPHDSGDTEAFTTLDPRQLITVTPYALQTRGLFVSDVGNIGIGTTTPKQRLHNTGDYYGRGHIYLYAFQGDGSDGTAYLQARDDSGTSSIGMQLRTQDGGKIRDAVYLSANGNVGIGTTTPAAKLDVSGGAININNIGDQATVLGIGIERSWAFKQQGTGSGTALKLQSIGGGGNKNFLIETGGNVGIGTLAPVAKLHVAGTMRCDVVEIMGADLAEKFPTTESLEPGMVVSIDPENAGMLRRSRRAYDRLVAGIVSGANGLSVGVVLGHLPGNEDAPPIALSGRVWVQCDASHVAISPGDFLTSSWLPGVAMKAVDLDRAQGAIIGKAMTAIGTGETGLVLVLVTLQ